MTILAAISTQLESFLPFRSLDEMREKNCKTANEVSHNCKDEIESDFSLVKMNGVPVLKNDSFYCFC